MIDQREAIDAYSLNVIPNFSLVDIEIMQPNGGYEPFVFRRNGMQFIPYSSSEGLIPIPFEQAKAQILTRHIGSIKL